MTRSGFAAATAAAALVGAGSRWPFRSHALFSWDSANFALATEHIDIAAHRPHPPGYLGYVLAARALNTWLHDVNLSLVLWNILATAAAVAAIASFAKSTSSDERVGTKTAIASAVILLTSPLLWFYGEIGEIYVSEMLVVLLVAFCSWRAARMKRGWLWCGAALGCAVVFKLSAAVLVVPCIVYGLARLAPRERRPAAIGVALAGAAGVLVLLAAAPGLPSIVWHQFVSTTADSRLVGSSASTSPALAFNRNIRDTLTAALAMLGAGSLPGLVAWLGWDRRLPQGISRGFAAAWFVPWLLLVTLVHIAKPGYILPLLPLAALSLGAFYARKPAALMATFLAMHVLVNTAQFALLRPFPESATGGVAPYHEKSFAQRTATDLQPLTFPTLDTIRRSDDALASLRATLAETCPSGEATIVADGFGIDWRRVMWYFPAARAIRRDDGHFVSVATHEDVVAVRDGMRLTSPCATLWVADDQAGAPQPARPISGVGLLLDTGDLRLTPSTLEVVRRSR